MLTLKELQQSHCRKIFMFEINYDTGLTMARFQSRRVTAIPISILREKLIQGDSSYF